MKSAPTHKTSGFTLIELSVVLVIIGLIIGGILTGREMIHAAELRSDISKIEKFTTAINTFKAKYNCLPADCKNATSLFPAPVYNGDGDDLIVGDPSVGIEHDPNPISFRWEAGNSEVPEVANQLALAHLIAFAPYNHADTTTGVPGVGWPVLSCKACGIIVTAYKGANYIRVGIAASNNAATNNVWMDLGSYGQAYPPEDAYEMDTKMDDGKPLTGAARDWVQFDYQSGNRDGCETTSDNAATFNNEYNVKHAPVGGWGVDFGGPGTCTFTIKPSF